MRKDISATYNPDINNRKSAGNADKSFIIGIAIAILFDIAAVFLLIAGIRVLNDYKAFLRRADTVPAVVCDIEREEDTDKPYKYFVDYSYNGKDYTHLYYKSLSSPELRVGDTVYLKLSPKHPTGYSNYLGAGSYAWLFIIAGGVGGAFFTFLPVWAIIARKKRKRQMDKTDLSAFEIKQD